MPNELASEIGELLSLGGENSEQESANVEENTADEELQEENSVSEEEGEEVSETAQDSEEESETEELSDESGGDADDVVEEGAEIVADADTSTTIGSESSETIALRAEVKQLRETLQTVTMQMLQQQQVVSQQPVKQVTPIAPTVSEQSAENLNLLEGVDFDEALTDPGALNRLLVKVVQVAQQQSVPAVTQQVLATSQRQAEQKNLVDNFYQANPELSGVRQTVSIVAQNLGAANPNLTTEQLLEQTAGTVRTMLHLPAKSASVATAKNESTPRRVVAKPASVKTPQRKKKPVKKTKSELQNDLDAMFESA